MTSIPGAGGPVGWIYVNVFGDTSGLKDNIEDAAEDAGEAGGERAGQGFNRQFSKTLNKELAASSRNQGIRRLAKRIGEGIGDQVNAGINAQLKEGVRDLDFNVQVDFGDSEELIRDFARKTGQSYADVEADVTPLVIREYERRVDLLEREQAKALKKQAANAEAERKRQEKADEAAARKKIAQNEAFYKRLAELDADFAAQQRQRDLRERAAVSAARDTEVLRTLDELDRTIREGQVEVRRYRDTWRRLRQELQDASFLDDLERVIGESGDGITDLSRRTSRFFRGVSRRGGGFTRVLLAPFRLLTSIPNIISGIGSGFSRFGNFLARASANVTKFSRTLGVLGSAFRVLGLLFTNPITAAATLVATFSALAQAITLLSPLVINLAGVFTLLVSAVGNAASALALFVPIFAGLGVAVGVAAFAAKDAAGAFSDLFKAGLSGDPKDWEAYNEAVADLGPNARKAVKAVEPLARGLKGLQETLEQNFFAAIGPALENVIPKLGRFRGAIEAIATSVGNTLAGALNSLFDDQTFLTSLDTLLATVDPIVKAFGGALTDIFAGLTNFFAASAPVAVSLAESIGRIAEGFRRWTESEENREGVRLFFEGAARVAGILFDIILQLGELLITVFTDSQEPLTENEGLLNRISGFVGRILDYLEENPDALKNWFDRASEFAVILAGAAADIVREFVAWNTPENQAWLLTVIEALGEMVRLALELIGTVSNMAQAFYNWASDTGMLQALGRLAGVIGGILGTVNALLFALGQVRAAPSITTSSVAAGAGPNPNPTSIQQSWAALRAGSDPDFQNPYDAVQRNYASGGLVTSATRALIGEAGAEMVIPLQRPLHAVDPAVREVAKMVRDNMKGKQIASSGPSKTINLTQNITTTSDDPRNVAAEVMNRAVPLARM